MSRRGRERKLPYILFTMHLIRTKVISLNRLIHAATTNGLISLDNDCLHTYDTGVWPLKPR